MRSFKETTDKQLEELNQMFTSLKEEHEILLTDKSKAEDNYLRTKKAA